MPRRSTTPAAPRRRTRRATAPTPVAPTPVAPPVTSERFDRYRGLVDPAALQAIGALVVGVGAIGRQVAISLATMGVGKICMVDYQSIDTTNLGSQGWPLSSVGQSKVETLKTEIQQINPTAVLGWQQSHSYVIGTSAGFPAELASGANRVVFMCVDSLYTREVIFRDLMNSSNGNETAFGLMVDGRMGAETCEIHYALPTKPSCLEYLASMHGGPPLAQASCTARSTFYCAGIAANLMVSCMVRWLRGDIMPPQTQLHIPTFTVHALSPAQMIPETFRPVYTPSDPPAPETAT